MPKMKIISRLLLGSLLLVTLVSHQNAMAGGNCSSGKCNVTYVAPPVQRAPATASTSHAFTANGGSRVANINLSQEARDGINAGGKEPPLPKGCVTAADRAKSIAKQTPLYGWPEDEAPRVSSRTQLRYSSATHVSRNSRATVRRTPAAPTKPATAVKVAIAAKAKEG